ncbi:MAG: CheB methylesterase domain-containing protein, partial [Gammaproteobacteria bacterium]|nr:CheB methylesterase domain-containing protein [Gammaproteobacteria bacterium]
IIEKVKMASLVTRDFLARKYEMASERAKSDQQATAHAISELQSDNKFLNTTDKIIAIGSSTGGTEAVKQVLQALPPNVAGIVVAQHIPITFSGPFAQRLNDCTQLTVTQAKTGDLIMPGRVYIAPGDKHLIIKKSGAKYYCKLEDGPEVNRHKPSVEVLFNSVAECAGPNAMGIMLTGMGADGAKGMLEMRRKGSFNVAQDEKTSVVWGMPGAAVKLDAVEKVVPLNKVADEIIKYCQRSSE